MDTEEGAMRVPIIGYGMGWQPKVNKGRITVRLQNGQNVNLPVESAEEFTALATILNESPVFFDTESGEIVTGWEQVGG
jgi:hypothetical protein